VRSHRVRPERGLVRGATRILAAFALVASGLVGMTTTASAVTDPNPSFEIIPSDLEFILKQIKISENHAAGGNLLCPTPTDTSGTCVPHPQLPWGLRTVDGSFNNLLPNQSHFGAADQTLTRLLPIDLRDGEVPPPGAPPGPAGPGQPTSYAQTTGFTYDSHPRVISNLIVDLTTANPAAVAVAAKVDGSTTEGGSAPTQVFTELNEDDPALTYTEPTSPVVSTAENMALRTGGTAVYLDEVGGEVNFTFTDGFRWIGNTSSGRGIAEVYIDDVPVSTIDQYSPADTPGLVHFAVDGLGTDVKTARIVNTGERNPSASVARTEIDAIVLLSLEGGTGGRIFIPNEAPDEGLSAPFNTWMTFFGQFFDHGLDLVSKGGSGTVVVPLKEDDPLYRPTEPGPDGQLGTGDDIRHPNFLTLTRATNQPGPDGVLGTADDVRDHNNITTPFVDQNQTYTSHPSHHVFLREYRMESGRPVATGQLLDGAAGGLANWAEVKEQARTHLGILLDDYDVVNVPLLRTDPYGNFVPGTNGLPQVATANGFVAASLSNPVSPDGVQALRTNHAFLDDIAHAAAPFSSRGDPLQRATSPGLLDPRVNFDGDLLDAHFITGDGRGNENIGLTSVHHVFHAEHNRVADDIERILNAPENAALKTRYQAEGANRWSYGQRLFQAARYVTEMEYQHLVFEEFGRTLAPFIDAAPLNESTYHTDIDAAITAEFAHVVYRFGHSMLTETVHRDGFGATDLSLLDAFLNPHEFTMNGALTPDQAAGAVVNGMVANPGSGIDEFVTETLRNELLGLPLDLAAINIMRGRDAGVPPLQTARERFFAVSGDTDLKPYANWREFGAAMRNPESLVNFIAAYGTDPTITAATTVADKRAAAQALVTANAPILTESAATSGLNTVDFWMGGLAERNVPFAGFLGTTFNFVFETQMERLQNGDRFYYLSRNIGLNLFHQLEANSFSALIMRTTDASLVPAQIFATPDHTFDLNNPQVSEWAALGFTDVDGVWTYKNDQGQPGDAHINVHGTTGADRILSGIGDDALWGHDGNDYIRAGAGADSVVGGRGDDILLGEGDDDNIKGGAGNDAIHGGSGEDLLLAGSGKDFVFHGSDVTQSFAGTGDDFVLGGAAHDIIAGNEGDDWLEGGAGSDLVQGDNSNGFQNDPNGGHDVLWGNSGNDDLDSEGGDDIMIASPGTDRHEGMLGFDWVTHKGDPNPANVDMDNTAFQPDDPANFRDRYDFVEGLSGWSMNDILRGVGRQDEGLGTGTGHELTQAHLDRVAGLRELLGGGENPPYATPFMTANTSNNIIFGGPGSDLIEGRGGDDFIDGSASLNVQLSVNSERFDSLTELQAAVFAGTVSPGDISIVREVLPVTDEQGAINSASYSGNANEYTCKVVGASGNGTTCDRVTPQATSQMWTVEHTRPGGRNDPQRLRLSDGLDTLRNIQQLKFADTTVPLLAGLANNAPAGVVTIVGLPAREGDQLVASNNVTDGDGIRNATRLYTWQVQDGVDGGWGTAAGQATTSPGGITNDQYTPTAAEVGHRLRVIYTYSDGRGQTGTIEEVISDPTEPVLASGETAPASVSAMPTSLAFGDQTVATTSTAQTITVSNDTTATITVTGVVLTGTDASSFGQVNACGDVAPGASCTVDVTFTPTTEGEKTASVEITHTGPGSPITVSLSGVGVAAGTSAPVASVSPTSVDFLDVEVGQTSTSQVSVVNTGTANLNVTGVTVTGADAEQFAGTPAAVCATLAPNASCTVSVTFTPTSEGAKSATLAIAHNAAASPTTVALTGNGVVAPPPAAVASLPTTVDFGIRRVGQTRTQNVQVTNTGTADLEISDVTATETSAGATFTATRGDCPQFLAPGRSCRLSVSYTPLAAGPHTGTLTVTSNDSNSPTTAGLTGTGR